MHQKDDRFVVLIIIVSHNKMYFDPSKQCAFAIDQMVKKRLLKSICIPVCKTTKCVENSRDRGILIQGTLYKFYYNDWWTIA